MRSVKEVVSQTSVLDSEPENRSRAANSRVVTHGRNPEEEAKRRDAYREALDSLFARAVPPEYSLCRPGQVPEIQGLPEAGDVGACFRGGPGIGKTFAATALAYAALYRLPCRVNAATGEVVVHPNTLLWVSAPELIWKIRGTFNKAHGESGTDILNSCLSASVMVIDDLGAGKATEFVCETFYAIISGRRNARRYTIITTNQTLDEIHEWEPRIASRLGEMRDIKLPNRDRRNLK